MTRPSLSAARCLEAVKMSAVATVSLFALFAVVAEPLRGFAADTTEDVSVIVASGIAIACDANNDGSFNAGETLALGTITDTGDTGTYAANKQITCKVTTGQVTGYTLGWHVATGSGGTATGHLISQYENLIRAAGTGSVNNTFTWPSDTTIARWGGRVSSTSSGTVVGNLNFGTDTASERYARVATGSSVAIRQSTTYSQTGGDKIRVHFRAYVGSAVVQPTGTYKATVTFTATTQ